MDLTSSGVETLTGSVVETKKPTTVPAQEVLRLLTLLADNPQPARPAALVGVFRTVGVSPWRDEDVATVAALLDKMDREWSARLQLISRRLPGRQSEFGVHLHTLFVNEARSSSGYPEELERTADASSLGAWVLAGMRNLPPTPPAATLVALWPHREESWFPEIVLTLIRGWAKAPKSRSAVAMIAAQIFGAPKAVARRATELTTLLSTIEGRYQTAVRAELESTAQMERARMARLNVEERLRSVTGALEESVQQLASAKLGAEEAERALRLARDETANERLASETQARNEMGKLRSSVLTVLRHEVEQIRLYLDRPTPNVPEALTRLQLLDELKARLDEGDVVGR